jgi:WD40 repeat protein
MFNNNNQEILYISFNNSGEFFSIGTNNGFGVYYVSPLKLNFFRNLNGGIGIVEMLNNSNIFTLVGGGSSPKYAQNKLLIWDDSKQQNHIEFRFNDYVKGCKIKKEKLFVITEQEIHIISLKTFKTLEFITTITNSNGIFGCNNFEENYFLAWPDFEIGRVEIRNFKNLESENEILINKEKSSFIKAHDCHINHLELNNEGNLLATCSESGNNIKIFDTSNGNLIQNLRRGKEKAFIYSIAFSYDSKFISCSSDRGTVHIFVLNKNENNNENEIENTKSKFNYFFNIFNYEWSFNQIRLEKNLKNIINMNNKEGFIYILDYKKKFIKAQYNNKTEIKILEEKLLE